MSQRSQTSSSGPSTATLPSARLLAGIELVRARLPVARDFAELYACFDDNVVRVPDLWESSERRHHTSLAAMVATIAAQLRPGFAALLCSTCEVRGTGFWHGMARGSDAIACFFYDEPACMGLLTLANPLDGSHRTHFVRLTRVMLGHAGPPGAAQVPLAN